MTEDHAQAHDLVAILSELFAGLLSLIAVAGVVFLSYENRPIPPTLMVLVGVVAGAFFGLKGASGTVQAIGTVAAMAAKTTTNGVGRG